MKDSIKKNIQFFALEFTIIILSLSVTFAINDWKDHREREEKKTEILSSILDDIAWERDSWTYTDSVANIGLQTMDSILDGQLVQASSIANLLKSSVSLFDQNLEPTYLSDWKVLTNSNEPEMTKIRALIQDKSLLFLINQYLLIAAAQYDFEPPSQAKFIDVLDTEILTDLNKSWKNDNKRFKETGDSFGDLVMGNFPLLGKYQELVANEAFKRSLLMHSIYVREKQRDIILLHLVLDSLEEKLKAEIND